MLLTVTIFRAVMMETVSVSWTSDSSTRLQGAISEKTVFFISSLVGLWNSYSIFPLSFLQFAMTTVLLLIPDTNPICFLHEHWSLTLNIFIILVTASVLHRKASSAWFIAKLWRRTSSVGLWNLFCKSKEISKFEGALEQCWRRHMDLSDMKWQRQVES